MRLLGAAVLITTICLAGQATTGQDTEYWAAEQIAISLDRGEWHLSVLPITHRDCHLLNIQDVRDELGIPEEAQGGITALMPAYYAASRRAHAAKQDRQPNQLGEAATQFGPARKALQAAEKEILDHLTRTQQRRLAALALCLRVTNQGVVATLRDFHPEIDEAQLQAISAEEQQIWSESAAAGIEAWRQAYENVAKVLKEDGDAWRSRFNQPNAEPIWADLTILFLHEEGPDAVLPGFENSLDETVYILKRSTSLDYYVDGVLRYRVSDSNLRNTRLDIVFSNAYWGNLRSGGNAYGVTEDQIELFRMTEDELQRTLRDYSDQARALDDSEAAAQIKSELAFAAMEAKEIALRKKFDQILLPFQQNQVHSLLKEHWLLERGPWSAILHSDIPEKSKDAAREEFVRFEQALGAVELKCLRQLIALYNRHSGEKPVDVDDRAKYRRPSLFNLVRHSNPVWLNKISEAR